MPSAIALFLFGLLTAALSLQLPIGTLRAPDSGFFPLSLGLLLMGLALGHGVQLRLAGRSAAPAEGAAAPKPKPAVDGATVRVLLFMGVVVAATALLKPIGYVGASFLLMLGLLRVLGLRRWSIAGLIAAASAAASYVVFVQWLKIPLPAGPLGF
jgi:hypothetical protein